MFLNVISSNLQIEPKIPTFHDYSEMFLDQCLWACSIQDVTGITQRFTYWFPLNADKYYGSKGPQQLFLQQSPLKVELTKASQNRVTDELGVTGIAIYESSNNSDWQFFASKEFSGTIFTMEIQL